MNAYENSQIRDRTGGSPPAVSVPRRHFRRRSAIRNTDEWYEAIPADVRPRKDQPFYHLLAENSETEYIAYVSEQNLLEDQSGEPVRHPQIGEMFDKTPDGALRAEGRSRGTDAGIGV